jgi:cysteinyl-tRNA synthetase
MLVSIILIGIVYIRKFIVRKRMNKKLLMPLLFTVALVGCDDASEAIDNAQDAANKAVDMAQSKLESVDLDVLNIEQFGDAADSATEFAESIDEALNADYSNPKALVEVQEHIANAYSCLIEASSESSAEKLMNKVMSTISNQEVQSLIEKGIESAKEMQACVM